jgi:hypothetical protein
MEDQLSGWTNLEMHKLIEKSEALEVLWFRLANKEEQSKLCNILGIGARQLRITTIDEWKKLALTSLTVHYHDQKGNGANWFDLGARSYTVQEQSLKQPLIRNGEFTNNTIISVYDTVKKKRVLVDGNDRATILTTESRSQTKAIIDIMLYEWYDK